VALLVRGRVSEHDNVLVRLGKRAYEPLLDFALRRRLPVVAAAGVAFVGSLLLFQRLGSEFAPNLDEGDVVVMATRPASTSLEQATEMQFELELALAAIPEVATVFSRTGTAEAATDPMPPNLTDTFIMLKDREHWPDPKLRACSAAPTPSPRRSASCPAPATSRSSRPTACRCSTSSSTANARRTPAST
jgi:cobalt-zinc-cadmium resistance protein CzcA